MLKITNHKKYIRKKMLMYVFLFILLAILSKSAYDITKEYFDEKWWAFHHHTNFPFKCHGKTLWYSRSVAVVLFAFCKNKENEWCVLANKRGNGTPDYQGYWNAICGYLDFSETTLQGAARECKEETGIEIPVANISICGINSDPTENRQNVIVMHKAILDGTIDEWSNFSRKYMEKYEVEDIQWIPFSQIDKYNWAFHHDVMINKIEL